VQSFHAVVKPAGQTRPAWKVLRVLANLLNVQGMDYDASQDVLKSISLESQGEAVFVPAARLSNACDAAIDLQRAEVAPVTASIYQLDGMVRRATSLQLTADAKRAVPAQEEALS
jgi:NADH-quinone oxidoreductase subunit G